MRVLSGDTVQAVRTLHTSYRVTDLAASRRFYTALGYEQVGRVDLGHGASLTMLKFPAEDVVTLELAYRPTEGPVEIALGSATCQSRSTTWMPQSRRSRRQDSLPAMSNCPAARTDLESPGLAIRTDTGLSLWSGHPATPTDSPRPTLENPGDGRPAAGH